MLLAMRRESDHHHHSTVPTVTVAAPGPAASPSVTVAVANTSTHNNHSLTLSTSNANSSDSLNTPSTPLLNLGRSPLQYTAPPPPPPPISVQPGPQFGFYTPTAAGASSYFHHYTHPAPTYVPSSTSVGVHAAASNGSYATSSESCQNTAVAAPAEELEEFVDIFQVQHLLLDHSAANGNQPPPHNPTTTASSTSATTVSTESQIATTATSSNATAMASLAKPQPRPRLNLQKASDYAAQHRGLYIELQELCKTKMNNFLITADSPSSRRMLLDYPSPYLYGNHYHTSPSEDLVALWFGSNGSG